MKSDDYILSYVNHFKSIIDNDLEREVFSYLVEREEQNLDGHIKEIHQYLCKKYKRYCFTKSCFIKYWNRK